MQYYLLLFFSLISSVIISQENCETARIKYLQDNPDVKNARMDPWVHYKTFGQKEGRKWAECTSQVLTKENCETARVKYLQDNPDVKNARMDPWIHFTTYGQKEGRNWPTCTSDNSQISSDFESSNLKQEITKSQTVRIGKIEVSISDVPGYFTKNEALNYVKSQPNWRLPTIEELELIYENRNKLSNLRYGYDIYLAHGNQNNFTFPNTQTEYGWSDSWARGFGTSGWFKPEFNSKLCLRLVKSENSNKSNNLNNQNNNKVDYMYCSSGNCEEGFGTMIFPERTGLREYTGTWRKRYSDSRLNLVDCKTLNCKFEKGKLTYSDGSFYDGSFDSGGSGLYEGYGYLFNSNGTYEKGDFFEGYLNGFGEEKKSDGIVYKGKFVNGIRQGICTLTYPNGDVVNGRYWNGKFISQKDDVTTAKLDSSVIGKSPCDKKVYSTISINGKEWMTENLSVLTFRNGDQIPQANSEQDLLNANLNQQPVWCYYEFNPATETHYGKLYNWYAVNDSRGLLPLGYVIPSKNEWLSLNNFDSFKNTGGRAQLFLSEGKDLATGKINKRYFYSFEYGPSKEKKYDNIFGTPESQLGFYWTTAIFQDQYNDLINVFVIGVDGKTQRDNYLKKGTCVSIRGVKGFHNYYEGSWVGNLKSGYGTENYCVTTELKGYGLVYKGDKYVGLWKNGQQNGEGTIIQLSGSKKSGLWKQGVFVGEWKLIDNRHKCFQCNLNMSKSIKLTEDEISQQKIEANSNEINLYKNESYCSSSCNLKAEAERKARDKKYDKEKHQNDESNISSSLYTLYDNSGYSSSSHILGYFANETVYDASGYKSSSHILAYCKGGVIYDNSGYSSSSHVIGYYKDGTIFDKSGYSSSSHVLGYFKDGILYDKSGYTSSSHIIGYYKGGGASCAAALAFLLLF
jgi:uncharacterized protein (TIGR02145 family)